MRAPILEELEFFGLNPDQIEVAMKNKVPQEHPYFVDLHKVSANEIVNVLTTISDCLERKGQYTPFPYPFYVITPHLKEFSFLTLIPSRSQLPGHFQRKTKRLKAKEKSLLNKTNVQAKKLANLNIEEQLKYLETIRPLQKELKEMTTYNAFLEQLLNKLKAKVKA